MIDSWLAHLKDPIRVIALACWAGAFGLTLVLMGLAWSAVEDANQAQRHLQTLQHGDVDRLIREGKLAAR